MMPPVIDPPDADVSRLFHEDRLILFKSLRLSRFAELSALSVHRVAKWKKMKSRDALAPLDDEWRKHALGVWASNLGHARRIQEALRETEDEVRAHVRRWFPTVTLGAEMHSWRFTLTQDEPLHFDVYAERVISRVIRVFVNLDTEPRVWDIGPVATPDDAGTFDPGYRASVSSGPAMRYAFAPGDVWVVDSRRVAHAIIYGRRAAMFSFESGPSQTAG